MNLTVYCVNPSSVPSELPEGVSLKEVKLAEEVFVSEDFVVPVESKVFLYEGPFELFESLVPSERFFVPGGNDLFEPCLEKE